MNNRNKANQFYIFVLLILPILNNYRFFPIAFIYPFCLIGLVLFFMPHDKNEIHINKWAVLYFIYVVSALIVFTVNQSEESFFTFIKSIVFFVLVFINFYLYAHQIWVFPYALRVYKIVSLVVSLLIIGQFVLSFFNHPVSLVFPGLTANTGERLSTDFIRAAQISENRFSTFFLEPAHQSQYTVTCIALLLFSDTNRVHKKDLIMSIIMTIAVFCTTSLQGIIICIFIWGCYFYGFLRKKRGGNFGKILIFLPIAVAILSVFWRQPIIQNQVQKKISSFHRGDIFLGTSMYRRIKYGWDCYSEFDFTHKLFGCGYDNASRYLYRTGIGLHYVTREQIGYMSGLSKMFCELGLIGVLLNFSCTIFFIMNRIRKNEAILVLLITWFLIMFSSASFDGLASLIPLVFMMHLACAKKDNRFKANTMIKEEME